MYSTVFKGAQPEQRNKIVINTYRISSAFMIITWLIPVLIHCPEIQLGHAFNEKFALVGLDDQHIGSHALGGRG